MNQQGILDRVHLEKGTKNLRLIRKIFGVIQKRSGTVKRGRYKKRSEMNDNVMAETAIVERVVSEAVRQQIISRGGIG